MKKLLLVILPSFITPLAIADCEKAEALKADIMENTEKYHESIRQYTFDHYKYVINKETDFKDLGNVGFRYIKDENVELAPDCDTVFYSMSSNNTKKSAYRRMAFEFDVRTHKLMNIIVAGKRALSDIAAQDADLDTYYDEKWGDISLGKIPDNLGQAVEITLENAAEVNKGLNSVPYFNFSKEVLFKPFRFTTLPITIADQRANLEGTDPLGFPKIIQESGKIFVEEKTNTLLDCYGGGSGQVTRINNRIIYEFDQCQWTDLIKVEEADTTGVTPITVHGNVEITILESSDEKLSFEAPYAYLIAVEYSNYLVTTSHFPYSAFDNNKTTKTINYHGKVKYEHTWPQDSDKSLKAYYENFSQHGLDSNKSFVVKRLADLTLEYDDGYTGQGYIHLNYLGFARWYRTHNSTTFIGKNNARIHRSTEHPNTLIDVDGDGLWDGEI